MDSSLGSQHRRAAQILILIMVEIGIAGSVTMGAEALIPCEANSNSLSNSCEERLLSYPVSYCILRTTNRFSGRNGSAKQEGTRFAAPKADLGESC